MFPTTIPLAERLRPTNLDTFVGQQHLIGRDGIIRRIMGTGTLPSMIFWGPPGVGKTTLALIIARNANYNFFSLSAISAGVKEVREVIEKAKHTARTLLFIDEIHRFNKSQQDALLGAIEKGIITLIGATTENPSFEVNSALLSRCQVYTLQPLSEKDLTALVDHAIRDDEELSKKKIEIKEYEALFRLSGGDARKLLNLLEISVNHTGDDAHIVLTDELVTEAAQQKIALYDKSGEMHYDIISAFIKSIRGSDPNAAVYWLARMIAGGEDVSFIGRRLLILASEDIGNANPTALVIAQTCFQAVNVIGYPEAEIILSQAVTYLASSPKSNASYVAIKTARGIVQETGDLPVPLHLRNAPTGLMKKMGYGKGYQYAHDHENNFANQEYLPAELKGKKLYDPGKNAREDEIRKFLKNLWKDKYGY
jgi:putative ATPase